MDKYSENTIRNVIFVSHSGAGKTTLIDSILYTHGAATRQGSVDEGNSLSDYDPIEISRKISINVSLLHAVVGKVKLNCIDTPGYADFLLELRNAVPAADAAILLVSAYDGVEVGTQRTWDVLEKNNLPRGIFVSKIDKENSEYIKTLESIQENFGKKCVPITMPIGNAETFKGVANLLTKSGWDALSDDEKSKAEKLRESLIEQIAEVDDNLVEKYLNGDELSDDEIAKAFKEAIKQNIIVPVFCGNALAQIGVKELVEIIVQDFPAPVDRGQIAGIDPKSKEEKIIPPKSDQPFSAYIFKTISDPYVGQLSLFRVYSGELKANTDFYNVNQGTVERFGQLYSLQGKEQVPVDAIFAGDIAAVAKLKNTKTGDSVSDSKNQVIFENTVSMEPAISFSLKPKTRQDEEKISQALAKLTTEDKGIKVGRDAQTKELILSGMGDMHLEITIERLKNRYHVDVAVGTPKVAYKETVKRSAKVHHKHKKQSGGRGQYGDVWLQIDPLERGGNFEFVDKIVGGVVPRQYIPSVEKGVRKVMGEGSLAGYPLVDVRVTLYDGSYHDVDSSDMAFQIAGGMALRKGVLEASPILLEPIMDVEVVIPGEYMGAINGDLSSRRGRVQGMEAAGRYETIRSQVPLAEMLKYANDLRSMTQGRGSYTMHFSHYEEVPGRIAEKIIAMTKVEHKEE
ncbi:MAG: elongation factor G [PVC group bacterium]|nr:elongation factor G [PVC group bacterium]